MIEIPQRSRLLSLRNVLSYQEAVTEGWSETTRVHHAARQLDYIATRCSGAAASGAGDRVSQLPLARRVQASGGCVPHGPANVGLRRRSERRDPFPLGRGPIRSPAGDGRRACSRERSRPGDAWRRALSTRGQSCDLDDPDCLQPRRRPVKAGLVASLNRPGGNATGVSLLTFAPEAKRLGLLHEVVPNTEVIGALINPNYQGAEDQWREVQDAARAIDRRVERALAASEQELEPAFEALVQKQVAALLVTADPFFNTRRDRI